MSGLFFPITEWAYFPSEQIIASECIILFTSDYSFHNEVLRLWIFCMSVCIKSSSFIVSAASRSNHAIASTSDIWCDSVTSSQRIQRYIISKWKCGGLHLASSGTSWTPTWKIPGMTSIDSSTPDSSWNSRIATLRTSVSPSQWPPNCCQRPNFLWSMRSTFVISGFTMNMEPVICHSRFSFTKAKSPCFSIQSITAHVLIASSFSRFLWSLRLDMSFAIDMYYIMMILARSACTILSKTTSSLPFASILTNLPSSFFHFEIFS